MRDDDVGLVPVVDGDRLVGTVTDRDIAIRVVAEERDPRHDRPRDRLDGLVRSTRSRSSARPSG